jgi:hypothetical protein
MPVLSWIFTVLMLQQSWLMSMPSSSVPMMLLLCEMSMVLVWPPFSLSESQQTRLSTSTPSPRRGRR